MVREHAIPTATRFQTALDAADTKPRSRMEEHALRKKRAEEEAAAEGAANGGAPLAPRMLGSYSLDTLMDGKTARMSRAAVDEADRRMAIGTRSGLGRGRRAGAAVKLPPKEDHPHPAFGSAARRWDARDAELVKRADSTPGAVYDVMNRFPGSVKEAGDGRGVKLGKAKPMSMIERCEKQARGLPAPGANQPKHGFSTLNTNGGGFNLSRPKGFIDQHLHEKKGQPAPGANQPKHGFSTLNTNGGGINQSRSKTCIEQAIHDGKDTPPPGVNQPKGGFSTLRNTGGGFNMSKPKGMIDDHLHQKRGQPAPGENQPKYGFSTLRDSGGGISTSPKKTYIDHAIHGEGDSPGPGEHHNLHHDQDLARMHTHNAKQKQQQEHHKRTQYNKKTKAAKTWAKMKTRQGLFAKSAFGNVAALLQLGAADPDSPEPAATPAPLRFNPMAALQSAGTAAGRGDVAVPTEDHKDDTIDRMKARLREAGVDGHEISELVGVGGQQPDAD